ncbi:MAG: hypothetical protein WCW66_06535 [Patescibacteria group bacterium]
MPGKTALQRQEFSMPKDPNFPGFPEEIPLVLTFVSVTFPTGLVAETLVCQRTIRVQPMLEYQITLWGKDFDGFDQVLTFRDGKWFATNPEHPRVEFVVGLVFSANED